MLILFNHVGNVSDYDAYAALYISTYENVENAAYHISVNITNSVFYNNGIFYKSKYSYITLDIWLILQRSTIFFYMNNSTVSASGDLGGNFYLQNEDNISAKFNEVTFIRNSHGGSEIRVANVNPAANVVMITSHIILMGL